MSPNVTTRRPDRWRRRLAAAGRRLLRRLGLYRGASFDRADPADARPLDVEIDEVLGDSRGSVPPELATVVRHTFGARAALFGLVLADEGRRRADQLDRVERASPRGVRHLVLRVEPFVSGLPPASKVVVAERAAATLGSLSRLEHRVFKDTFAALVRRGRRPAAFDHLLVALVSAERPGRRLTRRPASNSFDQFSHHAHVLLSGLAWHGHTSRRARVAAYREGADYLDLPRGPLPEGRCSVEAIDWAVHDLAAADAGVRRRIVRACLKVVTADGAVTDEERELVRLVCRMLSCGPWAGTEDDAAAVGAKG